MDTGEMLPKFQTFWYHRVANQKVEQTAEFTIQRDGEIQR